LRRSYRGGNGAHRLISVVCFFVAAVLLLVALAGESGS
jgi:hypothetical protein